MRLGHGKSQELHVMTQQSKIWVRKSRAQPTFCVGEERWERKVWGKTRGKKMFERKGGKLKGSEEAVHK